MSFLSHLECSASCGSGPFDPRGTHHLCICGAPLLARYNVADARRWPKISLKDREPSMWRYREMMPLVGGDQPITLGEGFTPLLHANELGRRLGLKSLYIKDESLNPTNSFKARGLSAAVTRAAAFGAKTLSVPSAGNAGAALAAYAARAGLEAKIFFPRDVRAPFVRECRLYGAEVTLVDGLITDAGRVAAERGGPQGWYDVSTLKEPYRLEGKKTMGYEIAEQFEWRWPEWIVYPTGGGTGLIGMWKAFEELEQIGWVAGVGRPRMVSVQAEGCAPIVRAFEAGHARAEPWPHARTVADGLRVPQAIGDALMLRTLRDSGGTAIAVTDEAMVAGMRDLGSIEGVSAGPEAGAALAGLRLLVERGMIGADQTVVLFNTGGALKYLELLA